MDTHFLIDGIRPSSFINRRIANGKPINSKAGKYRMLDLVAIARANNHSITPPRLVSKSDELAVLANEIESLNKTIDRLKDFLKPQTVALSNIAGHQAGYRLLRESEITGSAIKITPACGVYFLVRDSRIVYVGQSRNVRWRIYSHQQDKEFDSATSIECSWRHLDLLESLYIHLYEPEYNFTITSGVESGGKFAPMNLQDLLREFALKNSSMP